MNSSASERQGNSEPRDDSPPGERPPPGAGKPRRSRARKLIINIVAVGALVGVLYYLHTRVVRVAYIPTRSMIPALQPGDRVLIWLGAYRHRSPAHNDIIAFWHAGKGDYEVKRVIGVAGDAISIAWGVVFRNGDVLHEPYVKQPMIPERPLSVRLGPKELFVMGDNRNSSEDSRDIGPISEDQVVGRVFFRILPLRRAGWVR